MDLVAMFSTAALAKHSPVSNRLVRFYWCKHDHTQIESEATKDFVSAYGNLSLHPCTQVRFLGLGFLSEPFWAPSSILVMICFFLLLLFGVEVGHNYINWVC